MSFRLFIYYCALCGGWAAFVGWMLGRMIAPGDALAHDAVMGFALGLMVAFGLGMVDSVWNLGMRQLGRVTVRVLVGLLVGAVAGLLGGMLAYWLGHLAGFLSAIGWMFMGLLVGASIGSFEVLAGFITKKEARSARKRFLKCMIGGMIGGFLGGMLDLLCRAVFGAILNSKNQQWLWTPTALGFVALGACIGLLVAWAQVFWKDAWVKVESGFRAGREMILAKENIVIGGEESDVALFGDSGVEKSHAEILKVGNQYYIEDKNSSTGTFINDQQLRGRSPLQNGDMIRVGNSVLRFYEKQKR